MDRLNVYLLGDVRVALNDLAIESRLSRTARLLLAYLLLDRQRHHSRDSLADLFWGQHPPQQARNCLNTALWRLRATLEPEGTPRGTFLVTTSAGTVGFNPESELWLDVSVFEGELSLPLAQPAEALPADDARRLANALQLYRGDLLEGIYDDWVLHERERLRNLRLNTLTHLMAYQHLQRDFEAALAYGQQILLQDPLREDVHRHLMRLYLESGQRTLALRQYEVCREMLAREMGLVPMLETQALYAQVNASANSRVSFAAAQPDDQDLQRITQQLAEARQALEQAHELVDSATQALEQYALGAPAKAPSAPHPLPGRYGANRPLDD